MKTITLRSLIPFLCFIFIAALGFNVPEVFAASNCPDASGNCEIEGHVNVTDPDPADSNFPNVYKIDGDTILRRVSFSQYTPTDGHTRNKQLMAIGTDAGLNFDTDFSACDGLSGANLTDCMIANRSPGNTFIGNNAGKNVDVSVNSTIIGREAGANLTYIYPLNTIIGTYANKQEDGSIGVLGGYNTIIGGEAGYNNEGWSNTFLGAESGLYVTTGDQNILVGLNPSGFYSPPLAA